MVDTKKVWNIEQGKKVDAMDSAGQKNLIILLLLACDCKVSGRF